MKLKRIAAAVLSAAAAISMGGGVLIAHAADTAAGAVNIIASVSGVYSLVIPQTIYLSRSGGGEGPGTYTGTIPVCVKGTLSDNQYVTVSVDTPTLTCDDGTTVTTSLNAPKAEWTSAEVAGDGTSANFAVSTELEKPGEWSGTANFGCELGSSVTLISFTIDGTAYQAEEGMTWLDWVNSSYNIGSRFNCSATYSPVEDGTNDGYYGYYVSTTSTQRGAVSGDTAVIAGQAYLIIKIGGGAWN